METARIFSTEEIKRQQKKITNSLPFRNSPILMKFLEYVISEKTSNRESFIKEYTIAVNLFGRSKDFNPHDDAIVRINAGRLRRALSEYYFTEGLNDPMIIHIPKGSYIPMFGVAPDTKLSDLIFTTPEPVARPVVAIFPLHSAPHTIELKEFASILCEQLSTELSKFRDLSILGYYSMETTGKIQENILEAGASLNADFIISGVITLSDEEIKTRINLLFTRTGEVLISKTVETKRKSPTSLPLPDEILKHVLTMISDQYDIIFTRMIQGSPLKGSANNKTVRAISNYYKFQREYSLKNYTTTLSLLKDMIDEDPSNAVSQAMLGDLYLSEIGLGISNTRDPLEEGYRCALKSLKIDSLCQYGWYTMMHANLLRKEKENCFYSAHQCIELNPNNTMLVSGVAARLICAGYFDEGYTKMEKIVRESVYYPWWINCAFCLYFLHNEKWASALLWIEKIHTEETFWYPLLKAVSLSYLNRKEEAEEYLKNLHSLHFVTPPQINASLSKILLSEELVVLVVSGLEKIISQMDMPFLNSWEDSKSIGS